jgi:protein TonB
VSNPIVESGEVEGAAAEETAPIRIETREPTPQASAPAVAEPSPDVASRRDGSARAQRSETTPTSKPVERASSQPPSTQPSAKKGTSGTPDRATTPAAKPPEPETEPVRTKPAEPGTTTAKNEDVPSPEAAAAQSGSRTAEVDQTAVSEESTTDSPVTSARIDDSAPGFVEDPNASFLADDPGSPSLDLEPVFEPRQDPEPPRRFTPPPPPKTERGALVELGDVDVGPTPISKPLPEYDAVARRFGQHGTVSMKVLIDENGRVTRVELVKGIPRSRLNDSAMKTVRTWTYKPAMKDGVPVKVWQPVDVKFAK